jgi:hypothetical protein
MLATVLLVAIVALKFVVPALLVRFPFQAGWANFVLDSVDGDLLIPLGLADPTYQRIDKSADWVTYVFMVVAAWHWPIRKWIIGFFVFRTVGQILFFVTGDERVFFFFPNFLEPLFLIYATILFFKKEGGHAFYQRHRIAIWIFIVLYKLQDEWVTHVGNVDRSDLVRRLLHI